MIRFYLNKSQIYLIRLLKIAFSLFILTLIVFNIFPFFADKTGWLWAVLITYVIGAYLIIPLSIRFKVRLFRINHIPAYTLTPDGLPMDPVNILFICDYSDLNKVFNEIGWHKADKRNLRNIGKMAGCILLRKQYRNAPFSSLYLFGRKQDLGFQKPVSKSPISRHHIRLWRASYPKKVNLHYWDGWHVPSKFENSKLKVWFGAATEDTGLGFRKDTFQLTHAINKNANHERDFIIARLRKSKLIKAIEVHSAGDNLSGLPKSVNHFITDGKIKVVFIKKQA